MSPGQASGEAGGSCWVREVPGGHGWGPGEVCLGRDQSH